MNTHHDSKHGLRGGAGAVKAGNQKQAKGNIQRSFERSKNSFLCWNEQVCVCQIANKFVFDHISDGSGQGRTKIYFEV